MHKSTRQNCKGYSLIETMAVIAVLGIVTGLLYAYSDEGWKLFYQSYSRGLSQIKARLAIKVMSEELREGNKNRLTVGTAAYAIPLPDDASYGSPYIYFTKPNIYEETGDVIAYDYVLYYFAKPKEKIEEFKNNKKKPKEKEQYLILKSIKFLNQSKYYTEDESKTWPFFPPILEIHKSKLPEDDVYLESVKQTLQGASSSSGEGTSSGDITQNPLVATSTDKSQEEFLDYFVALKKQSRNIPISGNFTANSLTDTFSTESVSILFGQDYKSDKLVKIKVSIQEQPFLFSLKPAKTEFEIKITPRN